MERVAIRKGDYTRVCPNCTVVIHVPNDVPVSRFQPAIDWYYEKKGGRDEKKSA